MSNNLKTLFVALIIAANGTAVGQWVHSFDSYHGSVCALGQSRSNVLAGAKGGGIFSSSDSGTTWGLITSGEIKNDILALAASDSFEFAGTNGGGLFVRRTSGGGWGKSVNGLSDSTITALLVASYGNVVAGTKHGVSVSTDGGAHWSSAGSPFSQKPVFCLAENDSGLFAGTDSGEVYCSVDSGITWKKRSSILNERIVSMNAFGGKLFAATPDSGVFVSADGGLTWAAADSGLANMAIMGLASNSTKLFAGTWMGGGGGFMSADTGKTWTRLSGMTDSILTAMLVRNANIYVSSNEGLSCSTNEGANWSRATLGGINSYSISSFVNVGSTIFAGTYGGGVLRSTDGGTTWAGFAGSRQSIYCLSGNDSVLVAGFAPGIWRSTDEGLTWSVSDSDWNGMCYHIHYHDSAFYAAYGINVHITRDGGLTWRISSLPQGVYESANDVAATDSTLFVATGTMGVFKSTNDGKNWVRCGSPVNDVCITVNDTMLYIGTSAGVFRSSDRGGHWSPAGLSPLYISTIVTSGRYLFAGTDSGIYASDDNGTDWEFIGQGLSDQVDAILVVDTSVFVGTSSSGVLSRKLDEIMGVRVLSEDQLPKQFALEQNFPNPFNPSTVISYQLAVNSYVTLKVYDILGKKVATLVDENKSAGSYQAKFDGSRFASGIYFYRLEAGNYINTKKLLLLK